MHHIHSLFGKNIIAEYTSRTLVSLGRQYIMLYPSHFYWLTDDQKQGRMPLSFLQNYKTRFSGT